MRNYQILILTTMTAIMFLLTLLIPKLIIEKMSQKKINSETEKRNQAILNSFKISETDDSIDEVYQRTLPYQHTFKQYK